jgi:hypothetical protein
MMRATLRWATLRTPPPLDVRQTLQSLPPGWAGLSYFWQEQPSVSVLHLFYAGRGAMPRHLSITWLEGGHSVGRGALISPVDAHGRAVVGGGNPTVQPRPQGTAGRSLRLIARSEVCPHLHALKLACGEYLIAHTPVQYIPTLVLRDRRHWIGERIFA